MKWCSFVSHRLLLFKFAVGVCLTLSMVSTEATLWAVLQLRCYSLLLYSYLQKKLHLLKQLRHSCDQLSSWILPVHVLQWECVSRIQMQRMETVNEWANDLFYQQWSPEGKVGRRTRFAGRRGKQEAEQNSANRDKRIRVQAKTPMKNSEFQERLDLCTV